MNWFWNSRLVVLVENLLINTTNYIWRKRRELEKVNSKKKK